MTSGSIRSIRELVISIQFDEDPPAIGEVLVANSPKRGLLLVDHLAEGNTAICLNVTGDETLVKNMPVQRTAKGIEIPVGDITIGRVLNALGHPLDGLPIKITAQTKMREIMKVPGKTASFKSSKREILETGLRVIDFFT